jgi:hypothetical protein
MVGGAFSEPPHFRQSSTESMFCVPQAGQEVTLALRKAKLESDDFAPRTVACKGLFPSRLAIRVVSLIGVAVEPPGTPATGTGARKISLPQGNEPDKSAPLGAAPVERKCRAMLAEIRPFTLIENWANPVDE